MRRRTKIYNVSEKSCVWRRLNIQKTLEASSDVCNVTGLQCHFFVQINSCKSVDSMEELRAKNFQVSLQLEQLVTREWRVNEHRSLEKVGSLTPLTCIVFEGSQ